MKEFKDIVYGEFVRNKLDLYIPDCENFPVFIYFHGGGIEAGDKKSYVKYGEHFTDSGIAFVAANYRMYPTAHYTDFVCDAAAVVAWVKNHIKEYGECDKIFVGGSSAGGYLSQMLCFDSKYLAPYKIKPTDITAFIHDAGQPTVHFNIMRERGFDSRRVVIDEAAPMYHIGVAKEYPPMMFIVSDNDIPGRYEQTMLFLKTMEDFEYDMSNVVLKEMHGKHCQYISELAENGIAGFINIVTEYIKTF